MEFVSVPNRSKARVLRRICILLCLCVVISLAVSFQPKASTTSKQFSIRVGQSVMLSLKGVDESVIWRVIKGHKLVKLRQNGLLTAKKPGKVLIKVVYNGVTYRFRTTIRARRRRQSVAVKTVELVVPLAGITGTPTLGPEVYTAPPRANLATTSGKKVPESDIIMIGDSRFEGMHNVVGGSATWITSVGEGIYWLRDTVIPQLDSMDVSGKAVVINLGINDLTETNVYISVLKSLGTKLRKRKASVYFMTVNPVDEAAEAAHGYTVSNQTVVDFNRRIAKSLTGFGIIDTYDYLVDHSFTTSDGLHYSKDVYEMIYSVLCSTIRA